MPRLRIEEVPFSISRESRPTRTRMFIELSRSSKKSGKMGSDRPRSPTI